MKNLLCFLALTIGLVPPLLAQDSEAPEGFSADLSVIGRIEATPWFGTANDAGSESGFSFGNSSLYTLFEGNIINKGSHTLYFCLENHWLSNCPKDLYQNTFHSDYGNWLDMAYLTYSHNWFEVSAGKFAIPVALYEYDDYDYDCHFPLTSSIWNCYQVYQWGVNFGFMPSELFTINAYAQTSPYGEKPFNSGSFVYGGKLTFENETFSIHAGYSAVQYEWDKTFDHMVTGGLKWSDNGWTIYDDMTNRPGDNYTGLMWKGFSNLLSAKYEFNDKWNLEGRFEYNYLKGDSFEYEDEEGNVFEDELSSRNHYNAGINLQWLPFEGFRAHLQGGYQFGDSFRQFTLSAGITYTLSFSFQSRHNK